MSHDVATPFERTAVDRSGKGVIDDERHAMLVSHLGKTLDVEHAAARVGDGLAKETLGVLLETSLDLLVWPFRIDISTFDAELLHRHTKEVVGAAVDIVGCDEVVASLTDIEHCIEVGSLTRRSEHTAHATLKGIDFLGYSIVGRIGKTGIEIAVVLKVEQTSHLFAGVVFECC